MALEHTYEADGVDRSEVRSALSELTDDDVSESSPVTAGGSELAVVVADGELIIREGGHDGEWTKTSETAVRRAVSTVNGVGELVESSGGYEPDD